MRIVIAEDDPLLREGLALLLRAEGLDVVGTADTAEERSTPSTRTSPTWPSSTYGCRPRTPTRGSARP